MGAVSSNRLTSNFQSTQGPEHQLPSPAQKLDVHDKIPPSIVVSTFATKVQERR